MGFFELAGAFLDGFFSADESLGDFIERYSDLRSAVGAALFLEHTAFSSECSVTVVIVDPNGNTIDSKNWTYPYNKDIKQIFGGKKQTFYSFGDSRFHPF
jgi:hypothetical protein